MDQRCPKICYQKKEDGLTVTACYGIDGQIYLPDELAGEPITAIAPYAFSDREPEEGDFCWMEEGAEALLSGTSSSEYGGGNRNPASARSARDWQICFLSLSKFKKAGFIGCSS